MSIRGIKFKAYSKILGKMSKPFTLDESLDRDFIGPFDPEENDGVASIVDQIYLQNTGLKDKNGKEIYEGDIVKYHWFDSSGNWIGGDWIVKFGEADTSDLEFGDQFIVFYLEILNQPSREVYRKDENRTIFGISDMLEVIGNIYENPELLNK